MSLRCPHTHPLGCKKLLGSSKLSIEDRFLQRVTLSNCQAGPRRRTPVSNAQLVGFHEICTGIGVGQDQLPQLPEITPYSSKEQILDLIQEVLHPGKRRHLTHGSDKKFICLMSTLRSTSISTKSQNNGNPSIEKTKHGQHCEEDIVNKLRCNN